MTETILPQPPSEPEFIKNARWVLHLLQENAELLKRGPVIFVLLAVGWGAYQFGKSTSGEEVSVQKERIAFLSDQVSAYKDRLQGATPDQAAKQIAILQSRLESSEKKLKQILPDVRRHLSSSQKELIASKKDSLTKLPQPIFVYAWSIGDSAEIAGDFVVELKKIGVQSIGPIAVPTCLDGEKGVMVGLKNSGTPSDGAKTFYNTLKDLSLNPSYTKWNAGDLLSQTPDFDLFICPE